METIGVKEKEEQRIIEQHVQEQVDEQKEEQEEQAGTTKEEVSKPLSNNDVRRSCSSAKSDEEEEKEEDVGPRERLKRHRREVAGNVGIPDRWGQENFLTDWIDCTAFDASLLNPHNILLARASLIRQQSSPLPLPLPPLPLENSC